MEDWTGRYLESIELMRLRVDGMDAVFYHDPDGSVDSAYVAEIQAEHVVVQGRSVAHCIEELRISVEFMRLVAERRRSCVSSSSGRAPASQAGGGGFESRLALSMYAEDKPRVELSEWEVAHVGDASVLLGVVGTGHPRLDVGERIRSSRLLRIDFEELVAETCNTVYILVDRGPYQAPEPLAGPSA